MKNNLWIFRTFGIISYFASLSVILYFLFNIYWVPKNIENEKTVGVLIMSLFLLISIFLIGNYVAKKYFVISLKHLLIGILMYFIPIFILLLVLT